MMSNRGPIARRPGTWPSRWFILVRLGVINRGPRQAAATRLWATMTRQPFQPRHARAVLDAISIRLDGGAAGATTITRKRSVFANVLRYAVELGELPSNPLDRLSWKPPKVSDVIDRRVVVNPRQARELLTAVTYVGHQAPRRYSRGHRLMALFACMYLAALRPAEAVALRRQDCYQVEGIWARIGHDHAVIPLPRLCGSIRLQLGTHALVLITVGPGEAGLGRCSSGPGTPHRARAGAAKCRSAARFAAARPGPLARRIPVSVPG
jgi:integrase